MAAPLQQTLRLVAGDAEAIVWDNCDITVEFLPNDATPKTLERRALLAERTTVQERMQQHLLTLPDAQAIFYDHRTGEAADYVCVTRGDDGEVNVSLYQCKGAGGPRTGVV